MSFYQSGCCFIVAVSVLMVQTEGQPKKWWNSGNIQNTDCVRGFDACYNSWYYRIGQTTPTQFAYCQDQAKYYHCMLRDLTPDCLNDPFIASNIKTEHQNAFKQTISCSLGLDCSSYSVHCCLKELDKPSVLRIFLPMNDQRDHAIEYNDKTCRSLSKSLDCISDLANNCKSIFYDNDYAITLRNTLNSHCNNSVQLQSTKCDSLLQDCVGADTFQWLSDIAGSLFLYDKNYCKKIPLVYQCIESLRPQCPPDLYSIKEAIGSFSDPEVTLISDCITIVGGSDCRSPLRECIAQEVTNGIYNADIKIRCRSFYQHIDCYNAMIQDNPECFNGWWQDALRLRARNALNKICPVTYDICTVKILNCMAEYNTGLKYDDKDFCVYSLKVYQCFQKFPTCTLNSDIYEGPADPNVLKQKLIKECHMKESQLNSTNGVNSVKFGFGLLFSVNIVYILCR